MSGTLPSWEESFVLKQNDGDSSSSDTFDYKQLSSSLWRSQEKNSLHAVSSDIQLSVDNKQGSLSMRYPDKSGSIGLLSALDRALLGRDDGNRSNSSAFQSKQQISSSESVSHDNDIGSHRNNQSLYKFDLNERGKYTSMYEDKHPKFKFGDAQQFKGLKSAGQHVDRSVSTFSAQKIPHEVGVSEGKEISEQQNIPTTDKAVPALQNYRLEFLPSEKPASSSSQSSTKEEKDMEKIILTNLSECKKVVKYLLRCLKGIKLSVDNDGDIKSKVPDFYVEYETNNRYSLYIHSDDNWHQDLNDFDGEDEQESVEARSRAVRQESKRLLGTFRESLTAIFDCCETRKAAYVAQIKKIREVSNMATRNAMQTERLAGDSHIKHVTEMVETSQRRALDEAQRKLLESERTNRNLDIELQQLKNTMETYVVRDQRRLENQKQAVDEALRAQRESFEEASKQQLQLTQEEARRAARDAASQIESIHNNNKARARRKAHEDEMKVIFAAERERIEDECKKLRQQLVTATAETCRERERAAARSQDERDRLDKLQQEFAQESSVIKAQMQQQIVKMLHDHQAEKKKMEGDFDTRMENFKQSILTAHALDIAKLQDSTLAEMKRIKAEAEVRHQEDARRVRHLHEQVEMQRLLRENDRLRKIIIRNGGSSSFSYDASSKQSPVMRTSFEERIRQSRSKSPAGGGAASVPLSMSVPVPASGSGSSSSKGTAAIRRASRKGSKSSTETSASSADHFDTADSSSSGNNLNKSTAYSPPSSPAPPPPPPPATDNPSSGKLLDWTIVRQSIKDQHKVLQHSGTPKKDTSRYSIGETRLVVSSPPSSFPLDESLFASKRSSSSTSSSSLSRTTAAVDISTASLNAGRVGTYMSRLEEYLEQGSQAAISTASFLRKRDGFASASNEDENDDDDSNY